VIFLPAKTYSGSILQGFESGSVNYILKLFIQSELLVRIKTQLKIRKSQEHIIHYLKEILFANHKKSMIRQKDILMNGFNKWRGDSVQTDDIVVMGIKF
jgi:DNA-binding response OmpR family regulator